MWKRLFWTQYINWEKNTTSRILKNATTSDDNQLTLLSKLEAVEVEVSSMAYHDGILCGRSK